MPQQDQHSLCCLTSPHGCGFSSGNGCVTALCSCRRLSSISQSRIAHRTISSRAAQCCCSLKCSSAAPAPHNQIAHSGNLPAWQTVHVSWRSQGTGCQRLHGRSTNAAHLPHGLCGLVGGVSSCHQVVADSTASARLDVHVRRAVRRRADERQQAEIVVQSQRRQILLA